jgi:hypothetical protein
MTIVLTFVSFSLVATFPGWREERDIRTGSDVDVRPLPSRPVSQIAFSCAGVAAMLCLISGLWQHVGAVGAAAMVETANYGNVKTDIGLGATIMTWVGCAILFLVAIGLLITIMSIIVLDRFIDN